MGGHSSRPDNYASFEQASKSLTPDELSRLEAAFDKSRRDSISLQIFCDEVLSSYVPPAAAKSIFNKFANGGTKITFEDLVIGLVALTRSSPDERKKFLLDENDMQLPLEWIEHPPLLTDDSQPKTSTFYQVLAGVTHLQENEVAELEKMWSVISDPRLCKMTPEGFAALVSPPLPAKLVNGFFRAFDDNNDGLIDFKELVCGLSASCRGPTTERLKFLARFWDDDADGYLTQQNIDVIYTDLAVNVKGADNGMIKVHADGKVPLADFVCWVNKNGAAADLLSCVEEIGHVCLGLKPESPSLEGRLVRGYKKRFEVGDVITWHVLSAEWWRDWSEATSDATATATAKPIRPIDNSALLVKGKSEWQKLPSMTNEGGFLRPTLSESTDFELVSPALWNALLRWHGTSANTLSLPRQVVRDANGRRPVIELYPPTVIILRHQTTNSFPSSVSNLTTALLDWTKENVAGTPAAIRRSASCTVTLSRDATVSQVFDTLCQQLRLEAETARLWLVLDRDKSEKNPEMLLLSKDDQTLAEFDIRSGSQMLLEVRSPDLTWPEEVNQLRSKNGVHLDLRLQTSEKGATGLNNLGNTCYMNAALQCVSNTKPLTDYFVDERHLHDLNKTNALGSKGHIATEYGSLVQELWSGSKRVVAPLRLKDSVNRHVQTFKERAQHDCQEFLAFLLDGLHEDLNRVHNKPYATLKDSDGRPDDEVAKEAWDLHIARDQSVVMDLFTGMLKSCVTCKRCNNSSVRFDPFTFLQLPIPLEDSLLLQVVVVKRTGDIPCRYGFRLSGKTRIKTFEEQIGEMCGLSREQFVVICLKKNGQLLNTTNPGIDNEDSPIKSLPADALLYAFERPPSDSAAKTKVTSMRNGPETHGSIAHEAVQQRRFKPAGNAVLAVHRKMEHKDVYFLSHKRSRPVVFGVPLVVKLVSNVTTYRDLYEDVWRQVKRLVNAPAAQNSGALGNHTNRALDADEGRYDNYPFTLKLVDENFEYCSKCEWFEFCYGCSIPDSDQIATDMGECNIAVDWEPTALYLRYQHSAELLCVDDPSVTATWDAHYKPVSLMSCLQDFTTPEQLEGGEMVHCKHCKANTPASKKLDIWRLPKILLVHLKRFVYVEKDRRWVKSLKVIDFPLHNFDPSEFIVNGEDKHFKYNCFAIAVHYGAMGAGHYVAYAKNANSHKWYLFNDSKCKQLEESQMDKNGAYLLFYERVEETLTTRL